MIINITRAFLIISSLVLIYFIGMILIEFAVIPYCLATGFYSDPINIYKKEHICYGTSPNKMLEIQFELIKVGVLSFFAVLAITAQFLLKKLK
jgi:hypothetical protein